MQIENILRLRAGEPLERYMENIDVLAGPWGGSIEDALKAYESRTGSAPRIYCRRGPLLWVIGEERRGVPDVSREPTAVGTVWTSSGPTRRRTELTNPQ